MRHPRSNLSAAVRAALLAVLAMLVARGDALAQNKPSVAVLGLEVIDDGTGIDPQTTDLAKLLTQALRDRTRLQNSPYRLAPNSDKELLELKLLSGCANEARNCMAQIGRDLGADWLIYGKIEKRDTGYQVTLKLLKVETTAMERVTTEVIPFADNNQQAITDKWSRSLFNRLTNIPDQGNLAIQANVDQGKVFVDGQLATTLRRGRARIDGLAEGKHTVAIEADGHGRYESTVEVGAGKTAELTAQLQSTAVPGDGDGDGDGGDEAGRPGGTSRALFWVSAGITVAGAAGFTVYGLQVLSEQDKAGEARGELLALESSNPAGWEAEVNRGNVCDDLPDPNGFLTDTSAADPGLRNLETACDNGKVASTRTFIFGPVAAVGAIASAFFYYRGYMSSDSGSGTERAAGKRKHGRGDRATVQLTPTITPDYVGGGVTIEF
jgi:hypothetical protein